MKTALLFGLFLMVALSATGCRYAPGKPLVGSEAKRPDQVLEFTTLYRENCSACHGDQGKMGAAISLSNPAYLSFAGRENLRRITADGVPGTMMPPFSRHAGGMLTEQQLDILTEGMLSRWGSSTPLAGLNPIAYSSSLVAHPAHGRLAYIATCARCHGADGTGETTSNRVTGSIVDPAYLSLISDQGLRSIIVAGRPDQGMPGVDQTKGTKAAITDQDVTDIVAWLASYRSESPGQPYPQRGGNE